MKAQTRNTQVVSISLDPLTAALIDGFREENGLSRSAAIVQAIRMFFLKNRWDKLKEYGRKKGQEMGITSEEDVYRLMGDA